MKKYKIIYHIGDKPTLKTKVKKGCIIVVNDKFTFYSKTEKCEMPFNSIKQVSLFMLNGLGSMLEIRQDENTIFLSVVRFCIGQFAMGNFFGTRKLKVEIERCYKLEK